MKLHLLSASALMFVASAASALTLQSLPAPVGETTATGQASALRTLSGSYGGLTFKAVSTVIGQTSTATIAGGGNPIYLGTAAKYRGTVGLLMDYGAAGVFVCSGSLSSNRTSIITAGHCVAPIGGKAPTVTAYFYDGNPADQPVYVAGALGVTTVAIDFIHNNPNYTGNVIDQNDISVLHLASAAPAYAIGYELYTAGDLTGLDYNIAGYGRRSDTGGSVGVNLGTGRLRQGDNRYDFRLGDADFGGVFTSAFFGESPAAQIDYSYIADFDNGTAAADASCGLATGPNPFSAPTGPYGFGLAASAKYCNLGRGATEVSTAGGDSGGPQFIDGKLSSITSYGLTFGRDVQPGDIDNALNDSFGEFNGFVPIFLHANWINSVVPEPGTWALMIGGFGLVGASARRKRASTVAA